MRQAQLDGVDLRHSKLTGANLSGANLVISTSIEASKKLSYLNMVPVSLSSGEIPLYAEFLCPERDKLIEFLEQRAIIKKSLIIFPIL